MSITSKQKSWINKNKKHLTVEKMAKKLKISKQEILDYIQPHFSKGNKKIFYIVLIFLPILFFLILELSLRFFNFGLAHEQWVESNNGQWLEPNGKLLMLNPDIANKYFHVNKNIPLSNHEAFDKVKKKNSFRVFILGGSSGAGFPYEPMGSFSKYLKARLSLVYPDSKIEVVNCSMSAINSYTLRDLTPGIIEQKPDLVLIYAGHNEYYGALGAGSKESVGNIRFIVNLVINLEKYRTFQLVRNTLNTIAGLFAGKENLPSGTLMERMVQNQYIEYESDIYNQGLSQFEGNLNDILEMIKNAEVPAIVGTLTSNLKDQYPFVSYSSSGYPPAENVYKDANRALSQKNYSKADSLFRFAKDLDGLRFRAPSEINNIIYRLAQKNKIHVLDIDSAFAAESPNHIIGSNLMVDHLHPTFQGYQLIGKLFFDKMKEFNYLPNSKPRNFPDRIQDSITVENFHYTKLDSTMAEYKILLLKNNWPFVKDVKKLSYSTFMQPKDKIDSLAAKWIEHKIHWRDAHLLAAKWYIEKKDVSSFLKEMDVLIERYPYNTEYYKQIGITLIPMNEYKQVYKYLMMGYKIEPTAFITKWLGTIKLFNNELESARNFLNQSLAFNDRDYQVLYNLALTYRNDKNKALEFIDRALAIEPNYKNALIIRRQLINSMK